MASFIKDFPFIVNTGTQYIFRGYVYNDVLSKIVVLDMNYTPVSKEVQTSYTLTPDESKAIYNGIMSKDNV